MSVTHEQLQLALDILTRYAKQLKAGDGLSKDLFLLISSLTPIPNVDLFIQNSENQILLSRRNDPYYGKGWHVPGGCIRFGERMEERIQKNALEELKSLVTFETTPLTICDILPKPNVDLLNPRVRGHNITILFRCQLPTNYQIDNSGYMPDAQGYLKWFDDIPNDLLAIQHVYDPIFRENGYLR